MTKLSCIFLSPPLNWVVVIKLYYYQAVCVHDQNFIYIIMYG